MSTVVPAVAGESADGASPTSQPPGRRKGLLGALAGSTMEVFDWSIYSAFAPFFATSFFAASEEDPTRAFLETLIVLAVGFVARPIGSLIFGHISDTRGRRISLVLTAATALIGTLMIALSPTHEQIGIGAAIVLVTARLIQGLAHGGEQPAAGAYISEVARPGNRGTWSSLVYVSIMFGGLLGTTLSAVLVSTLGAETLTAWAWRIPFLIGAVGSLVAVYLVWRVPETEVFTSTQETQERTPKVNLWAEMWRARKPALQIVGLTLGITVAFQNWAAIGGYHIGVLGSNPEAITWTGVGTNLLALATLPLWGRLSDRIGRKPVMWIGLGGVVLSTWLLMQSIDGSWERMAVAQGISLVLLAAPLSILPALMAELVPTSIRTIGVGFSYALATAIFGGTVPALQTWISSNWGAENFGVYVTLAALVSFVVVFTIPETRGKDIAADATTADAARTVKEPA